MSRKTTVRPTSKPSEPAAPAKEEGSEALALARELADARKRWTSSRTQIGIGAAVGIGSAAIVAGLLYWRGNKK